jgi:hypothetical protein
VNIRPNQLRRGVLLLAISALLSASAGCSMVGSSRSTAPDVGGTAATQSNAGVAPVAPEMAAKEAAVAPSQSDAAVTPTVDRMIVSNASMNIQVDDVDKSIEAVRSLASSSGSQITELSVQSGDGGEVTPLASGAADAPRQSSSANLTLRVPAAKLDEVQTKAAKLGKVLTQSASESDVTQQHVDMEARLKNLQAEEARLREILNKATKVSEMLEIERELSRVRGEIESMQAQIAYLEQQAAMATLTLALTAPGALVQPQGGTWGFSAAVTSGFQAAAWVLRALITLAIALSPILLIVLVIVWIARSASKRRKAAKAAAEAAALDGAAAHSDVADAAGDQTPQQ